ncbi:hypothetical protein K0504_03655 [Neiella marina]|uniref:Uncharacterized protein n=1 Tax=Neiella holothuriorum TaxID=2870530 RepID=A0ABS7EE79_9GAMM|nr:hypothetical protein [Neiella holothuriorum]MBW8190121.1 hypothetical protein [Neiella holothuriorum]
MFAIAALLFACGLLISAGFATQLKSEEALMLQRQELLQRHHDAPRLLEEYYLEYYQE